MQRFASSVGEFDGVGTGIADLYLAEVVLARVTLKLLRPRGRRRQTTEQSCDYDEGEGSHGYYLHEPCGF